ncbi:MAG: undecaprenyl-diphosphate phosphatase [Gemmatimonadota bacterium]
MTVLEALVLGIVQGATEFLPVSSSGHLALAQKVMGVSLPGITFEVVVHVATLLSVTVVYRARLMDLARGALVLRDPESWRYVLLLALATAPAAVVGVLFGDAVEAAFESPAIVAVALLFTGAMLYSSRWALARKSSKEITFVMAVLIGLAQCVALVPGVSRSGSTVVAALWLGVPPVEAAAFSFLMSIPAIGGAAVLQLPDLAEGGAAIPAGPLLLGFLAASVVGVLAIRVFVRMLRDRSFPAFAWYCWAVGLLFLGWLRFA